MKKFLLFIAFFVALVPSSRSQESDDLTAHKLSLDFGSMRNRYLYPFTNVRYISPLIKKVNANFSLRLRSYGTLFIFSKSAYDITPQVECFFTKKVKPVYFSAGVGMDMRVRLVKDERSSAVSSAEPLVSVSMFSQFKKFRLATPLWTRFYSNGISFSLLPELSWQINKFSLFFRYEISTLNTYVGVQEWRHDSFVGLQFTW